MICYANQLTSFYIRATLALNGLSINEKVDLAEIENSKSQKLLGLPIDSELSFEKHINDICDKSKAELNALSRVAPFISFSQKKNANECNF